MMRFDIEKGTYAYEQGTEVAPGRWHFFLNDMDKPDKATEEKSAALQKTTFHLSDGVFFQDISDLARDDKHDKGEVRTEFSSRGITTPMLIHLGDNKSRFYTVLVDRYGGKVTLRKGNLSYTDFLTEES